MTSLRPQLALNKAVKPYGTVEAYGTRVPGDLDTVPYRVQYLLDNEPQKRVKSDMKYKHVETKTKASE